MKSLIILLLCAILPTEMAAQPTFSKVISNYPLDPENAWAVAEVENGYIMLSAGECLGQDIITCTVVSKIDKSGNIVWFKQYDFYPNVSTSLVVRNDRIYICGSTNQGDSQVVLYCLDLEGNILWNRNYGLPNKFEGGAAMVFTTDHHIIICGTRYPEEAGQPSRILYLVKTDLDGFPVGEYTFDFQNRQSLSRSMIETTDQQVLISYTGCPVSCLTDFTGGVASIDLSGNLNWNLALPSSFQPDLPFVTQTDPNTLVVNWHTSTALSNHDWNPPTLFYLDTTGEITDSVVFENQSLKEIRDIEPIWGKGLVISGSNFLDYLTDPFPALAGWVARVDENMEVQWDRTYSDTTFQGEAITLQSISPTNDGGYIAVGTIINEMTGVLESHNWILKLDSIGCVAPGCGEVNYVLKTEEAIFLKGVNIQIYPNPASSFLNIQFPPDFFLNDLSATLLSNDAIKQKSISIRSSETSISVSDIPQGTYFLVILKENEIVASKRVVIAR